jgi:hypothetical protein
MLNMNNYACISMTGRLQISDMIIKLRVCIPFLYELFPLRRSQCYTV